MPQLNWHLIVGTNGEGAQYRIAMMRLGATDDDFIACGIDVPTPMERELINNETKDMTMVTDRISDQERRIIAEQEQLKQQELHEVRELRWQNRQLRKTCGKQGQTIFMLRAALAEVRALNSKLERGELRRQERVIEELAETIIRLKRRIRAVSMQDRTATAIAPRYPSTGTGTEFITQTRGMP